MRVRGLVSIALALALAGCASARPEQNAATDSAPTARENVLSCLLQWDIMLYSYEAKTHGVDKEPFAAYLLKQYTHERNADGQTDQQARDIDPLVAQAIQDGVDEIYSADTDVPNFVYAMSGPIREGFNICMQRKNVSAHTQAVKKDIELAEFATIVAAAKKTNISEAQMQEQYGRQSPLFSELIEHVYSSPDFNAGSFRLTLWKESVNDIE